MARWSTSRLEKAGELVALLREWSIGPTPVRRALEEFLARNKSEALTLEVGAQPIQYGRFFPKSVVMDVRRGAGIDLQCDVQRLPFRSSTFATVVCAEVLEHVRDPRAALLEMRRVVGAGANLLLSTRFVYPFHEEPQDYWRFTDHSLRALLEEAGWEVVEITPDLPDGATVLILLHHWLFARKGSAWRAAKAAWIPFWRLATVAVGRSRTQRGRFPSGWHVLARPAS